MRKPAGLSIGVRESVYWQNPSFLLTSEQKGKILYSIAHVLLSFPWIQLRKQITHLSALDPPILSLSSHNSSYIITTMSLSIDRLPNEVVWQVLNQLDMSDLSCLYHHLAAVNVTIRSVLNTMLFENVVFITKSISEMSKAQLDGLNENTIRIGEFFFCKDPSSGFLFCVCFLQSLSHLVEFKHSIKSLSIKCDYQDGNTPFVGGHKENFCCKHLIEDENKLFELSEFINGVSSLISLEVSCPYLKLKVDHLQITKYTVFNSDDNINIVNENKLQNLMVKFQDKDTLVDFTRFNLKSLTSLTVNYEFKVLDGKNFKLPMLRHLYLDGNYIESFTNLSHKYLPNLQVLDLSKNLLTKLHEAIDLPQLRELNLSYNQLTKLQNLHKLRKLEHLILVENQIGKIENLSELRHLKNLQLFFNLITKN